MKNVFMSLASLIVGVSAAVSVSVISSPASAADKAEKACQFMITRTPCSDKTRDEALRPYGGKETAPDQSNAKDEAACMKDGEKQAEIKRKGVLSKKAVVISFNGKEIGKKEGTSDCK